MTNLIASQPPVPGTLGRNRIRIAKFVAGFNMLLLVAALILTILYLPDALSQGDAIGGIAAGANFGLATIIYSAFAVLIISRFPGHLIGWLFLFFGFVSALFLVLMGSFSLEGRVDNRLALFLGDFIAETVWLLAAFLPMTLTLQFFPNGRLPSRRWWPIPLMTVVSITSQIASIALHPWPWEAASMTGDYNPMAIEGAEKFFETLYSLGSTLTVFALIGSLIAVVVRFYRSRGTERQQMKWLVYTAAVGFSAILLLSFVPNPAETFLAIIFIFQPTLLALAIGIAIVRYRLFDIDVIIRRTLQYAILTGILALIYFGIVVSLQSVFSTYDEQQSPLFIVISTLVIAGLFNPLRRRIQELIDQRFYRKKYEAEQALAQFAATARDEVDLNRLTASLLAVIKETMQPELISMTLVGEEND